MEFNSDPIVLLTLGALVVIGGLGFFVWEEIASKRHFRDFSVYTKLVLVSTAVLILGGAAVICLLVCMPMMEEYTVFYVLLLSLCFGLVGFLDDFCNHNLLAVNHWEFQANGIVFLLLQKKSNQHQSFVIFLPFHQYIRILKVEM